MVDKETVKKTGSNPCPPSIISIGAKGAAEKAMVITKKAIAHKVDEHNQNEKYTAMEKEIFFIA